MLESSSILTAAVVILIGWLVGSKILKSRWKNRPPGPNGLPIIGNLHQLSRGGRPLEVIQEWKETYGDVVGIQFGQYRAVILNGYETIKEAFNMTEFSGRPSLKPFLEITGGEQRGLAFNEGQAWSEQRRFALRNLRDFGFGKKSMESFIHEDITELLDSFKEQEGKAFIPQRKFNTSIVRSLWNIIAGEKFSFGDPKFETVSDSLQGVIASTSITGPVFFIPWLATLFPSLTGWTNFKLGVAKAKGLIRGYIEDHQKTFQRDNIRDFIDIYLKEIEDTKDPNSSFYKGTGEKQLLVSTVNLFVAGSETTSRTIVWALLFLIKYPHVQDKLFKEVSTVIGNSRLPSLDDRDSCPYAWAVMEEVFRLSSLIPLNLFHNTMSDVTFKGYFIPKDTMVISNLYGIHHDKKNWGDDVEVFKPERFLIENPDGTLTKNSKVGLCIPFSVGKRVCLGEFLARNNFFLYLTSLVQKFELTTQDKQLNIDTTPGLARTQKPFTVVLKERSG